MTRACTAPALSISSDRYSIAVDPAYLRARRVVHATLQTEILLTLTYQRSVLGDVGLRYQVL